MNKPKIQDQINKITPLPAERRKKRIGLLSILLIIFASLCICLCIGLFISLFTIIYVPPPDKYDYWNNLVAKDSKPDNVSDTEYRAKNRAGYCWRDRKFYQPEELHRKAMVSFVEQSLAIVNAYRSNETTTSQGGGIDYTSSGCKDSHLNCRVWFIPQDYSNAKWDKVFHTEINPTDENFLAKYQAKEIKQPSDLVNYLSKHLQKGFSLNQRDVLGQTLWGANCCTVMTSKEAASLIYKHNLLTDKDHIYPTVYPESYLPDNIDTKDYGVGNFYLKVNDVTTPVKDENSTKNFKLQKSYQRDHSYIFLLNNCGDMLWHPHYFIVTN